MIIDRFEGAFAVAETDSGMMNIPVSQLPENVRVGDVIIYENERYTVDCRATADRRKSAAERLNDLLKK